MGHAAHCRVHAPAQHYPPAEATHEAVCEDAGLFLATLESLQRLLGINEKVPRVGGRELHLHTLYRQVTSLGGCEQVIASKQWRVSFCKCHVLQYCHSTTPDIQQLL